MTVDLLLMLAGFLIGIATLLLAGLILVWRRGLLGRRPKAQFGPNSEGTTYLDLSAFTIPDQPHQEN